MEVLCHGEAYFTGRLTPLRLQAEDEVELLTLGRAAGSFHASCLTVSRRAIRNKRRELSRWRLRRRPRLDALPWR